ncbi:GOLPH3/VPS74 family protein [Auritidibacter ignavus]|uniref:GOLPH3/VPS74 family protein n=1 Tax=Auritidibacter ignavus TaxID=678932 RepID=UPI00244BED90|nr:GPP34 family phosphoprotein [Auritidibacter ignavus]WGH84287.1 GPP34 family phosphoprotein [Auritidibacter ignavus]
MTTYPPAEDESTANPLSLGEMFLLLCIDDRGKLLASKNMVSLALAGAELADLTRRGLLTVTQDLVIQSEEFSGSDTPLARISQVLEDSPENQDAEQWIYRFGRTALFDAVLAQLEERQMVEELNKKILGIWPCTRYRKWGAFENVDIVTVLRGALFENEPVDLTTWPVLALMNMTGILDQVFPNFSADTVSRVLYTRPGMTQTSVTESVAEVLQATENVLAEHLTATRGGASGLPGTRDLRGKD